MQEEESYPYWEMQDCDSYGCEPNQEEEGWKEGCAVCMILFKSNGF